MEKPAELIRQVGVERDRGHIRLLLPEWATDYLRFAPFYLATDQPAIVATGIGIVTGAGYDVERRARMKEEWKLMPKIDYRNIEKVAGRCGGRAVVVGTRIRVSILLGCYRQGMTVEE